MRRIVIDMADDRPVFALPHWVVDEIRQALPRGWDVALVEAPSSGRGDGADVASPAALAAVEEAEVYMGFGVPSELLRAGPVLRWVHSGAAGVGGSLTPELLDREIILTNSAGVHGVPVAETVLAFILHFARGLDHAMDAQRRRAWDKVVFDSADSPVRELGRSIVGVVGLGGIGREVAARARGFGARVIATRRRPEPVAGVDLLTGPDALERLLEASDYVVLALPETAGTRGLIGREQLARMRPGAVLVNVARGGLVNEEALIAALSSGRLRGCALDVFTAEPLPSHHPLRDAPRLLITPHTSAYTHHFWERETSLILDNLERFLAGRPLLNVVDKRRGY